MTAMNEQDFTNFVDLVQQSLAQESANTKIVLEILENLKSATSALSDRVLVLEDQVINIIKTMKEDQ